MAHPYGAPAPTRGLATFFVARRSVAHRVRQSFSAGSTLPDELWAQRHRWILGLLWLHVPAVFLFALAQHVGAAHAAEEAAIVVAFAAVGTVLRQRRRLSTVVTSTGLMATSAVLVHLSHGSIEMHFHYFVMVGVVALYQDWLPFVVAIGFVVFQHGIAGALNPHDVYNHPAATHQPWRWAAIHGGFIMAMSATGIASWRLNEALQRRVGEREKKLAEAQAAARLGSWELDVLADDMTWSDELYRLLGTEPDECTASLDALVSRVHPDDQGVLGAAAAVARDAGTPFAGDVRIADDDEDARWLHVRVWVSAWEDGRVAVVSGTAQDVTERKRAETDLSETLSLLTATLDSTADGILVVDLEGGITSFNQRFVELWRIPDSVLESRDDDAALACVLGQLSDPEAFLAKVRELYAQPDAKSEDVIEFLDGRMFERNSMPQRVGGETVGRVWSFRDVTDQKRLESELSHQAFHDSLTGLANQALFRDRVDHALARATRDRDNLAALFIDLDEFKTINDGVGHTAGDELLVAVADRLSGCLRTSDSAARLGGDEFAVLLEDVGPEREAEEVAERIIASLRQPFTISGHEVVVSASIGIAFAGPGTTCDQLLRSADLAMYTAKRRGKSRFEIYRAEMHAAAVDRLEIEAALRRGLDRSELRLQYQPVVALATGRIVGVEALVRWQHPERGLLQPEAFIPMAEETGLIGELGRQVLATACAQVRRWQIEHSASSRLGVSVNISPRQLHTDELLEDVGGALRESGLSAAHLILEITETAMMHDTEMSIRRLRALQATGVRIAVDDFGTGYSSLSYLQRFPVEILKIDRAFVSAIDVDAQEISLAPAILSFARTLHLRAVAEGVETSIQADALATLGCELAQGFYFSEPVDAEAMGELLAGAGVLPLPEAERPATPPPPPPLLRMPRAARQR
ncbi:MAG: putative bifunctional diguanylate cyclase/phosphodiesterase [Actinomycetota bacterium]